MRKISLVCALACFGTWVAACSSDSNSSSEGPDGGESGTAGTSVGGASGHSGTGGSTSGTTNGGGGSGGTVGGNGGGGTGGSGGNTGGVGGTAGTSHGGGGTGGVAPPPPNYCDGHYAPLPLDVFSHFTYANEIGIAGTGTDTVPYTMLIVDNPNCDSATVDAIAAAVVDGGADSGTPDASTGTPDASTGTPDASTGTPDASTGTPDASTGTDAGGDAGPPAPSCYELSYDPNCTVAGVTGGICWGGVILQTNDGGIAAGTTTGATGPGLCVATGATHVSFEARASVATVIKFGSIREGLTQTEFWTPITTAWATYTVAIPVGEPYNRNTSDAVKGVWNGFSVVAANEDGHTTAAVVVQIRNVQWTN